MKSGAIHSILTTFERIGPAAKILLHSAQHRGELAAVEAGEARDYLVKTLAAAAVALATLTLFGFSLTFTVAALVWNLEYRGWILGGMTALYALAAVLLTLWVKKRVTDWSPLPETRNQLRADCASLQSLLPEDDDEEESP